MLLQIIVILLTTAAFPSGVVAVAELSLNSQLVNVPAVAVSRLQAPAILGGRIASPFFTKQVKELV